MASVSVEHLSHYNCTNCAGWWAIGDARADMESITCPHCGTTQPINASPSGAEGNAIDHPSHYNHHPSGVECIDVVEHMGFNLGNAIKYLWRCDHKGDSIEDLRKSIWYIEREIQRRNNV